MLALSLSDKFCYFGIFVFVFNRFLFFRFSFRHFFVYEFIIFSFFDIFVYVFVNENHTVQYSIGRPYKNMKRCGPVFVCFLIIGYTPLHYDNAVGNQR